MPRDIKKVKDNELPKDNKNISITTKTKKKPAGRPIKFKDPIVERITLGLTQKQKTLIDERMKEVNMTVRLDYIRSVIRKDIKDF